MQAQEIINYQKREEELVSQLSIPLDDRIQEILVQLKSEHEDLLHQQLAQLRRAYVQQMSQQNTRSVPIIVTENVDNYVETTSEQSVTQQEFTPHMSITSAPNVIILSSSDVHKVNSSMSTNGSEQSPSTIVSIADSIRTADVIAAVSGGGDSNSSLVVTTTGDDDDGEIVNHVTEVVEADAHMHGEVAIALAETTIEQPLMEVKTPSSEPDSHIDHQNDIDSDEEVNPPPAKRQKQP